MKFTFNIIFAYFIIFFRVIYILSHIMFIFLILLYNNKIYLNYSQPYYTYLIIFIIMFINQKSSYVEAKILNLFINIIYYYYYYPYYYYYYYYYFYYYYYYVQYYDIITIIFQIVIEFVSIVIIIVLIINSVSLNIIFSCLMIVFIIDSAILNVNLYENFLYYLYQNYKISPIMKCQMIIHDDSFIFKVFIINLYILLLNIIKCYM